MSSFERLARYVFEDDAIDEKREGYALVFVRCLDGYDAVALLNDVQHLRTEHANDSSLDLFAKCPRKGADAECGGHALRLYREAHSSDEQRTADEAQTALDAYMDGLEARERNAVQITSTLHAFLNHRAHDEDDEMKDDEADGGSVKIRALHWRKKMPTDIQQIHHRRTGRKGRGRAGPSR